VNLRTRALSCLHLVNIPPLPRESLLGWRSEREVDEVFEITELDMQGRRYDTSDVFGRACSSSSSLNFLENIFPDGLDNVNTMPANQNAVEVVDLPREALEAAAERVDTHRGTGRDSLALPLDGSCGLRRWPSF
jgi:hypothetical protein